MVISIITLSLALLIVLLIFVSVAFYGGEMKNENEKLKRTIKSLNEKLSDYNRIIIDLRTSMEEAGMAYSKIHNKEYELQDGNNDHFDRR